MSEIFIPLQEQDPEMWLSLREFIENFNESVPEKSKIDTSGKNNMFYGMTHSVESREKMKEAWKTRLPDSEETRKKKSESKKGKKNYRYGKKHSAETIKKMSEAKLGNTFAKKK